MSAFSAPSDSSPRAPRSIEPERRIVIVRAALALAWAAALFIAAGSRLRGANADLPTGVAALLASYPLIDVAASIATARLVATTRMLASVNAVISAAAVVAIAVTGFSSDATATLASFGAWAAVSGLIQLAVAVHRRRASGRQLPMIISGGLSTIVGIMFIAQSGSDDAHVTNVAGYMAFGAVLYLIWASREQARTRS